MKKRKKRFMLLILMIAVMFVLMVFSRARETVNEEMITYVGQRILWNMVLTVLDFIYRRKRKRKIYY